MKLYEDQTARKYWRNRRTVGKVTKSGNNGNNQQTNQQGRS